MSQVRLVKVHSIVGCNQLGVGKSDFGSDCSSFGFGFNPFGLENKPNRVENANPNQTEPNLIRFGLG